MTEYGLLLVLILVAAVGIVTLVGTGIVGLFDSANTEFETHRPASP